MNVIEESPRAKAEALIGEVLTVALSAGEITVNQARAVTAALEAAMAPPEGYVLVPVSPTKQMMDAAVPSSSQDQTGRRQRALWAAMLAARPEVSGG